MMRCRAGLPGAIGVALTLLAGCRATTEADSRLCPPSAGEFGTYGCALIVGQVVGSRGQPLSAIDVVAWSADTVGLAGGHGSTSNEGWFSLRLPIMSPVRPVLDSVSVWVRATVIPQPPQMQATIFDSVLVRAGIAAVGTLPDTAHATIALPVS